MHKNNANLNKDILEGRLRNERRGAVIAWI
jgi:hypothetical protein